MVTAAERTRTTDWKALINEINKVNALTDRVKQRKQEYLAAKGHISAARSRLATRASRENEGLSPYIRRARIFREIMKKNPVSIKAGELIVGSQTEHIVGASPPTDLVSNIAFEVVAAEHPTTISDVTYAVLTPEDRASLREDAGYWQGRAMKDVIEKQVFRALGRQAREYRAYMEAGLFGWGLERPRANQVIDYGKVLRLGFNGVIKQLRDHLDRLDFSVPGTYPKYEFLSSGLVCARAAVRFAHRYARLAGSLAAQETVPTRKKELEKIKEHCEWVPANPARTFHEALQSLWLTHLAFNLECADYGETLGRLDQYLYPFYEKDIREGRLTRQEAAELLGCLWVKLNEMTCVRSLFWQKLVMSSQNQHITICGVDADGRDATNELSVLLLEVARQMRMPQSAIYIRWHKGISEEVLIKAGETNRDHGAGIPAYLNDQVTILKMMSHGIPLNEARDWCALGCVGPVSTHTSALFLGCALPFNKPKYFELALNDGVDPVTGKRLGPATGDARQFKSYEEVYDAVMKQVEYGLEKVAAFGRVLSQVYVQEAAFPFMSILKDDCIEKGRGFFQGGARYTQGNLILDSGVQNMADSLTAIKKLVFEEKKITMAEILDALAADFEGKDKIYRMLTSSPCYGNDDDRADEVFNALSWDTGVKTIQHRDFMGSPIVLLRGGATQHYWGGQYIGALPDGRKAYVPLADGILSPTQGRDTKGPTAVLLSATKMNHLEHAEHSLHNMKIMPSTVRSREGIKKFLSLIRTYFDRGGWHLQFNMISRQTLLEAQQNPEQYRDLVVRVAGYSAFFVDLSREVQDDIIKRTEHEL
jgi:pyruvate formate-lyase/glycerol dehydratase family glycyl radical enzyme